MASGVPEVPDPRREFRPILTAADRRMITEAARDFFRGIPGRAEIILRGLIVPVIKIDSEGKSDVERNP